MKDNEQMDFIHDNFHKVLDQIQTSAIHSGRKLENINLVVVTKGQSAEKIVQVIQAGARVLGENYPEETDKKIPLISPLPESVEWHMIGHLQTNKVKYIPPLFDYVHSIDRWELLEGLERYGKELRVLFEINLSREPQKHGTTRDGLRSMFEKTRGLSFVKPVGLMTMAPFTDDAEEARPVFRALRKLLEEVNKDFNLQMTELSMGMSSDFETAIEEGATMVRVGTAIFGERL